MSKFERVNATAFCDSDAVYIEVLWEICEKKKSLFLFGEMS